MIHSEKPSAKSEEMQKVLEDWETYKNLPLQWDKKSQCLVNPIPYPATALHIPTLLSYIHRMREALEDERSCWCGRNPWGNKPCKRCKALSPLP